MQRQVVCSRDSYAVLNGIDKVIPVDAYIPGCPPRPEAIIDGVIKLLESIDHPTQKEGNTQHSGNCE